MLSNGSQVDGKWRQYQWSCQNNVGSTGWDLWVYGQKREIGVHSLLDQDYDQKERLCQIVYH